MQVVERSKSAPTQRYSANARSRLMTGKLPESDAQTAMRLPLFVLAGVAATSATLLVWPSGPRNAASHAERTNQLAAVCNHGRVQPARRGGLCAHLF